MKVFISADIEGVTDVTHWDETEINRPGYNEAREQMTAEVLAACEGALEAGAKEIWVRDAHDSARNLLPHKLPKMARLIRGWSPHPMMMMEHLDASFTAAVMIGYHSRAAQNTSPLAHTMSTDFVRVSLNGRDVSEFWLNTLAAELAGVPVAFVSGDGGLCREVAELNGNISTLAVKEGYGNSTVNIHPQLAVEQIKAGVFSALNGHLSLCRVTLPGHFIFDLQYKDPSRARKFSFYPGAILLDRLTVRFEHDRYEEILRFLLLAG